MTKKMTLVEAQRILAARNPMPLEVRHSDAPDVFEVRVTGETVWSVIRTHELVTERRILNEEREVAS